MTETTRTADRSMSEEMKSLLAPTIESGSSWRDLFLLPMAALLLAMLIGALIMIATSVAPATILQSFVAMARGSLGSMHALSETVTAAIPLVLSGLGIGLAFRAGLFNIGAEGQMVVGGLATAVASFAITGLPIWIHLPLALVIGLSVGALYAAIAGILKAATGAHEVISTIMLNLISFRLLDYVLRQPVIQKEGRSDPISKAVLETAELPRLLAFIDGNLRLHAGLFIMLLAVAVVYWLLFRSKLGFAFRISGENPGAARYAGIHAGLTVVLAMAIAGALAGLAGATQISGVLGRATPGFTAGIGFDAIAVALLGRSHPVGILLAGLLFGALEAGGRQMQVDAGVSIDLIGIIQALIIIFVAAPLLVRRIFPPLFRERARKDPENG
ncbi:MAG: ABC transporter permease [Pseudomonadota bacterium]|nr:ABC transporter permease [Pseudomonadota bacterium]MEC7362059.1 ABC transporter permease [Pseudomonadota bacterium]MEC7438906.1 ABC transporter permease [Pseudomonadota bacterium]MEC7494748.1 ABC transporter permease [Pseudomonadota bacterium]MEC7615182.1 ABC transporter permease [Pseudomonadota bacterium]